MVAGGGVVGGLGAWGWWAAGWGRRGAWGLAGWGLHLLGPVLCAGWSSSVQPDTRALSPLTRHARAPRAPQVSLVVRHRQAEAEAASGAGDYLSTRLQTEAGAELERREAGARSLVIVLKPPAGKRKGGASSGADAAGG